MLEEEYKQLRDDLSIMRMEVLTHGNGGINIPVNLKRLIWNAQVCGCATCVYVYVCALYVSGGGSGEGEGCWVRGRAVQRVYGTSIHTA